MPHPSDGHAGHDPLLVAAYAAGDAAGSELDDALALVAACPDCAALHHDLRAIATATAALPASGPHPRLPPHARAGRHAPSRRLAPLARPVRGAPVRLRGTPRRRPRRPGRRRDPARGRGRPPDGRRGLRARDGRAAADAQSSPHEQRQCRPGRAAGGAVARRPAWTPSSGCKPPLRRREIGIERCTRWPARPRPRCRRTRAPRPARCRRPRIGR